MRSSLFVQVTVLTAISGLSCTARQAAGQVTAPVIDTDNGTLTSYLPSTRTPVQNARPRANQRATDIDGTGRCMTPFGWSIAADTLGGGSTAWRKFGGIELVNGAYTPTEVDLAFPTLGPPVYIGRSGNNQMVDSSGRFDSNGSMGFNWHQLAQPEMVFHDADGDAGTLSVNDLIYLVLGADCFMEFRRVADGGNTFKAKNGAAGVAVIVPDITNGDEVHFTDQRGTKSVFFGFNTATGVAKGQLWTVTDAAGKVMTVNNPTKATAISDYTSNGGRVQDITDASGRVYTFTYTNPSTPIGGVTRLLQVTAVLSGTTVGTVEYGYYETDVAGKGKVGDLRLVTVSLPAMNSTTLVRSKYYQYYDDTWSNTDDHRGLPHAVRVAVGFEGVRGIGVGNLDSASLVTLKSASDVWFEYDSTGRVSKATYNGECSSCSGGSGTNGAFTFSYSAGSAYTNGTGYDNTSANFTVITQPDGMYQTHYFDEAGQARMKVLTNAVPDDLNPPSRRWVNSLVRDSAGCVTEVHAPDANNTITYASGAVTPKTSAGLITTFTRISSGNLAGLRTSTSVKSGSGGPATTLSTLTVSERQLEVGTSGISLPNVTASTSYPNGGAGLTTNIGTTYWSGTATDPQFIIPKTVTVTSPAVSSGNNGEGTSVQSFRYHRTDGSVAYTKDAGGVVNYSRRDSQGRADRQIADVNVSTTGDLDLANDTPTVWGLTLSGSPIHIVTTMTYDQQGRMLTSESPSVSGTRTAAMAYVVQSDGQMATFSFPKTSGTTYYGPASISVTNHAGKPVRSALIALAAAGSSLPGTAPSSDWSQRVDQTYDNAGVKLLSSTAFPAWNSTSGDTTTFTYDSMGRRKTVTDPTGTIRETVYDDRGLAIENSIGTDNTKNSSGLPTGPNNMVVTDKTEYDGGNAGGNGYVTKRIQDADGNWGDPADQRVTTIQYDWRGRAVIQTNPAAPHSFTKYDDLGRAIATGQYSATGSLNPLSMDPTTTSGSRIGLSETVYDERGQVARTTMHEINQSTGASLDTIVTNNWYDASGRSVKTAGTQISKTKYDRLGRTLGRYTIAKSTDSSYSDAIIINVKDTVVEESWSGIDPKTGRTLIQHTVQFNAGTYGGGQLSASGESLTVSGTAANGRVQMSATWYDDYDRPIESVQLGTNGGSSFARSGASVAARSDTYLRTSTSYDSFGRVKDVTDVAGIINRTEYDGMGRRIKTTDNYVDGTPGGGSNNDQDRVVEYVYTNGLTTSVKRKMPSGSNDQVTTYTYGVTKGSGATDSQIASNQLLKKVTYPPQYSNQPASDREMTSCYNALGQVIKSIDPAGNVIETSYDTAGRSTAREIKNFAPGFDTRVEMIETTYTSRGQLATAKQSHKSNGVLDETAFTYDNWGNPATMVQDPDSQIASGTGRAAFTTTWTWQKNTASNGWQNMKFIQVQQPGGLEMKAQYRTADAPMARVSRWRDENLTYIASYSYLGAGTVKGTTLDEPNVENLAYDTSTGSLDGHLDRFNRVTKNQWQKNGTSYDVPIFVDFRVLAYNRYGQPLAIEDKVLATGQSSSSDPLVRKFDAMFSYDALRRVNQKEEGQLKDPTTWDSVSRNQLLVRSLAGVATSDQVDLDANGNFNDNPPEIDNGEMDDSGRTFNERNELRQRVVVDVTGTNTYNLTYDKNGNLTSDDEKYDYVYNPFGQLVHVKLVGTSTVAANYTYNALGHRSSEQTDCNDTSTYPGSGIPDGDVTAHDPVFFIATDLQGRRVATYRGTDTDPKERFAYHAPSGYGKIGATGPILRTRRSSNQDPTMWATEAGSTTQDERYYYTSDFRGNVTAIVSSGGNLIEQYRYSATGVPMGIPRGDVNGSCKVEGTKGNADYDQAEGIWKSSPQIYHVRSDWDLDGDVDGDDQQVVMDNDGVETGRKVMSASGVGSRQVRRGYVEGFDSSIIAVSGRVYLMRLSVALGTPGDFSPTDTFVPIDPVSPTGMPPNTLGRCHETTTKTDCLACCEYVDAGGVSSSDLPCAQMCQATFDTDIPDSVTPPDNTNTPPDRPRCGPGTGRRCKRTPPATGGGRLPPGGCNIFFMQQGLLAHHWIAIPWSLVPRLDRENRLRQHENEVYPGYTGVGFWSPGVWMTPLAATCKPLPSTWGTGPDPYSYDGLPTAIYSPIYPATDGVMLYGPGAPKPCSQASCIDIAMCLLSYVPPVRNSYTVGLNDCRHGAQDALRACCATSKWAPLGR